MNTTHTKSAKIPQALIAAAVATALLAACASAPIKPAGAAEARSKLTQLQSDPNLGNRAPVAIKEADAAVIAAEQPQPDRDLAVYRVYMANTKVDIARAMSETRFAEDQRTALSQQREAARLDARTREADSAKSKVEIAQGESAERKLQADQARGELVIANAAAATAATSAAAGAAASAEQSAELQRQIEALQAKVTDRGLVLTLGDVLFTSGQADLKPSASGNLNKLVSFLNQYPNRTVMIEGFTDSVGTDEYNLGLSQRRADAVKSYLMRQGVGAVRLTASGKGESEPLEGNDTASGRQQNRRVAVIIDNPPIASR